LFVVQQLQHTGLIFSLLFAAFVFLGVLAFNVGGGFSRIEGAYVFFFTTLTCLFGVLLKAALGEAADSNLQVPNLLMAAFTAGMFMLLWVVALTRKLTGRSLGLANPDGVDRLAYTQSGLGCLVVGIALQLLNVFSAFPRDILSILNQLNLMPPLAILLGTIGAVRDSHGRRSVNVVSAVAIVFVVVLGVTGFSKQAMLTPVVCYVLAIWYSHFNLRLIHLLSLGAVAVVSLTIVPLIAGAREQLPPEGGSYAVRSAIAWDVLTHLSQARERQNEDAEFIKETSFNAPYYSTDLGFLQRFTIIPVDDLFFAYSAKGNFIGMRPIREAYINLIPHILYPNKPASINGNYYAHEIGGFLAPDDFSTGISFSPVSEAYHCEGWLGILLLMPAIWLMLFVTMDFICGDVRRSPWGLVVILVFAHAAGESLLGGLIGFNYFGGISLVVAIFFCNRVAPVIGVLFSGRQRLVSSA
jgi:hypothetical protein